MATGTFSQAKVWHSFLKARSPIVMRFKSDPIDSKYDDGKFVYFQVRGDETDSYYYPIETEEILQVIEGAEKGHWYKVTASGGPDGQSLTLEEAPTSSTTGGASVDQSYSTGYIVGDYVRCLEEAIPLVEEFLGISYRDGVESASLVKDIATTLYINWSHTRFMRPLNADDTAQVEYVEDHDHKMADHYVSEIKGLLKQIKKTSGKAHDGRALKTTLDKFNSALEGNIDEQLFHRMSKWLDKEITFQSESENGSDDESIGELPF